jgi:hypothetical protein
MILLMHAVCPLLLIFFNLKQTKHKTEAATSNPPTTTTKVARDGADFRL